MDEDLAKRVEWLERELQVRTLVLEGLLASTALKAEEAKIPGINAQTLEKIEAELAQPRAGETAEQRDAFLAAYRRIFSQVTELPPWRGPDFATSLVLTVRYYWRRWGSGRGEPPSR